MIRRFYVVPLREGLTPAAVSAAVDRLAAADLFMSSIHHAAAGVCIEAARPTVVWECGFEGPEPYEEYLRARYHATVVDRYMLHDSPEHIGRIDSTKAYGYHPEAPAYRLRRGIRRLILLRLPPDADPRGLADVAQRSGLDVSVFSEETFARRDDPFKPRLWTHLWEQGFRTRKELADHHAGDSEAKRLERNGFRAPGAEVESFEILAYPIQTRSRPTAADPSDHPGERLLQTFTVQVRPDDLDAYIALLTEAYDSAAENAGMRLESRWTTSAQLGELVTVQSTWSLDNDRTYHDVRGRLLQDERWWRYASVAETLVQSGSRHFSYSSVP